MKHLFFSTRLLCSLLLSMFMLVGATTPVWGEDSYWTYAFKSADTSGNTKVQFSNNSFTINNVTWTMTGGETYVESGQNTPTLPTAVTSTTISKVTYYVLKFGNSGKSYFKTYTLSTGDFSNKKVTKVEADIKNNGSQIGTLTIKQGDIQIGSATQSAKSSDWGVQSVTCSGSNGGTLEIIYSVPQASYIKAITIYYQDLVPPSPAKLSAPANLSSSNVTTDGATLSWDAVANASSYTVMIGKTEYPNATSPYSATGLSSNTEYTWTVQAVGDGTNYTTSDYADSKSFTTLAPPTAHTVTFNVGANGSFKEGEEFVNENQRVEASAGAGVALPEVVANPGFVFGGWSAANPATSTYVTVGNDGKYHPADNETLNAYYKVIPATPTFGAAAGKVEKGTEVTISCTTEGATIYYTTNGDEPTAESSVYSSAIALTTDQTIKAIAIKEDVSSSVASATYTIATHTARFSINGNIDESKNSTVAKGEAITFPANPADIEDFKFLGWTKIQNYSDAKDAPSDLCKSATMGTDDVTFYAVYANGEEGEPILTKLGSGATFAVGDKIVVMAKSGDNWYGLNMVALSGNYVDYFVLDHEVSISDITETTQYVTLSASTDSKWNLGHATNGYLYSSGSNNLTLSTTNKSDFVLAWNQTNSGFSIKYGKRWLSCRTDISGESQFKYRLGGDGSTPLGVAYFSLYKYASGEPTYSNYRTNVVVREISNIAVKTAPTTVNYCEGEKFNPAGLEITVNYTEGDPEYIAYAGNETKFSFSPNLDAELVTANEQVTITYKDKNCQQAINVRAVSISAPTTVEGTYTVKVGEAEAVTAAGNSIAAKKGQKIVLASTANPGYRPQGNPFEVKDEDDAKVSVSTAGGQYSFIMPGKNVTITAKFSKLYTLTADANITNGSITIKWNGAVVTEAVKGNKIVIDVTPDPHYTLGSLYYLTEGSETKNTISKTGDVYSFTMEDANTTIYATFAEDEKHEAIFYVNGEESSQASVYTGENVVFPETNPEDQGGKVFMGWASEQIDGTQADAPIFANETGVTMEHANIPFYAVFATATGSSTDYSYTLDTSTSPYNSDGYQNGEKKVVATCPTDKTKTFDVTYQITNFGRVSGQLQMKKGGEGYMYNTTDLGSIKSVTIDGGSNLTTYYGTSQNPTSATSVGTGNGYFRIVAGSTAGTCSSITVTFTQSDYTYSAYCTTVAGELSLVAQNNENGTIYYYATFSSEYDVEFEDDVVYTVTVGGDQMTLNRVNGNQVPANTGVLIKSQSNNILYKYISSAADLSNNMLKPGTGAETTSDVESRFYRLAYYDYANKTGLGFYYGPNCDDGQAFMCKAGTAYLAVPNNTTGNAPARFLLGRQDVPTDLLNVNDNNHGTKVLRDGRLYIVRDGKTYDSLGRMVK